MTPLLFSIILSASCLQLPPANNPKLPTQYYPDWTPGIVVLETNDTVACTLRYNQIVPEGLLQVLDGENVLTLSVRDVRCFFYYDSIHERHRRFFTLSVPLNGQVHREMFLEFVYGNDKVSILNHKTMGLAHSYMELSPFKQAIPLNKLYLLDSRKGEVYPISEENALSMLDKKESVIGFIETNGIRFRKLSDYVRVFEYEQSLL